jgi:diguanylate cyclase (GGDEF)-like protein
VAERMIHCVRDSDTVARIGGDEFIVLLPSIDCEQDALIVAEKIRNALNLPFELAQQSLRISCSIGISLYPDHADNEEVLMNYADMAMYQAKQAGRDRTQLFIANS